MGILQKYLIKIAAALREKNLISSLPGVNGGYMLTRPAEKITMQGILPAVEPELLTGNEKSKISDGVDGIVQKKFPGINDTLTDYFQSISLADYIQTPIQNA